MVLFHYIETFPRGKHTNLLKKKKKMKWSHRISCTSLSWPPMPLRSQAGQHLHMLKPAQLYYACTAPRKDRIITQLNKIPPRNPRVDRLRSAAYSCVNLHSWNGLSSVSPEIYLSHTNIPDGSQCRHPFLATPLLLSPLPQNNGKGREYPIQLFTLKKKNNKTKVCLDSVIHTSSKAGSLISQDWRQDTDIPIIFPLY